MMPRQPIQIKMKPVKDIGGGIYHSKVSGFGGPGGGGSTKRPTSLEKMYKANFVLYAYADGKIEIAKDRYYGSASSDADIDQVIRMCTRIIAEAKLKGTNLDMFKEGLSELLQEAIKPILEGDHYERTICAESAGDGS